MHLVTGGAGSGKSAVALQFLADGLARGETCAMLVASHGEDTKALATLMGIRVNEALRARRLHLFRWRPTVHRNVGHVTPVDRVAEDLQDLLRDTRASRVVIDSFAPFLADGLGGELLVEALESLGATSVLTLAQRVDEGYDRWLEPVVQRAAAVVHLSRRGASVEFECISRRGAPGLVERGRFVIEPGEGLAAAPVPARRARGRRIAAPDEAASPALLMLPSNGAASLARVPDVEA